MVSGEELNQLTGVWPQISRSMWLTKLSRRIEAAKISRDHVFSFQPVLHPPYR